MNTSNPLETRIRHWIPRRPSAKLERRLFDPPAPSPHWSSLLRPNRLGAVSAWLVVLGLSSYTVLRDPGLSGAGYSPVVAVTLSNHTLGPYLPGSYGNFHNAPPATLFEWTSPTSSPSSIPSLSLLGTNDAR